MRKTGQSIQNKIRKEREWNIEMVEQGETTIIFIKNTKITTMYCRCLVTQLCPTLVTPMDCSKPGFPVLHYLPEFAQTHVHSVANTIQPSHPLSPPYSSCLQSFSPSGSFPVSRLFSSGGQSIRASASASVLPMNIQKSFQ